MGGKHFSTLEAFRWVAYIRRGEGYQAKNAFGVEVTVKSDQVDWYGLAIRNLRDFPLEKGNPWSTLVLKIPIGPEEAKELKSSIRILLICKLEKPYFSFEKSKTEPTIKNPVNEVSNFNFVHVRLLRAQAYDPSSGTVYSTLKSEGARNP